MMNFLIILMIATMKCNARSLLDHNQILNSDFQDTSNANRNGSLVNSAITTTTLDPWDEFCKEACGQGLAGPECDCPEHLDSKKNAPNHKYPALMNNNILSVSTHTETTTLDPWDEFCKEACGQGLAGPECDCPEHLKPKKDMLTNKKDPLPYSNTMSSSTATRTTTLDPWEEFCKEACEEGLAGPECDCPEHLKPKKNMLNNNKYILKNSNTMSSSTPTSTTTLDPWEEFCKEACEEGLAGPECDCPEHLNLKKVVPKDTKSDLSKTNTMPIRTAPKTTTLDPWDEFCQEACEEGQAGPECDSPEHPIG